MIIAVPLINESASADDPEVEVTGRIVAGFDSAGSRINLSGVTVSMGGVTMDVTGDDGTFSFMWSAAGQYTLGLSKIGYSVLNYDVLTIDIADAVDGVLNVPMIAMVEAFGTITGSVKHNTNPASGILIYVHDRNSGDLVAKTASEIDGTYNVEVRTGEYTVSINNVYYEAPSIDVDLGREIVTGIDFELTVREGTTYLFGFDLTHSMMVIGGIIGLILLIFAILYRINIAKHPELSKIHQDRKKKDHE